MAEIGLTDLFIYKLTEYCDVNALKNVFIYHAKRESVYGADIDLFVEQASGSFYWFALQAKVMNKHGVYKDLKIKKKNPQQWEKLEINELTHGSRSFYLFYNGNYKKSALPTPTRGDCEGTPALQDYGYGIVERQLIANHFSSGATQAKFTDFFPDDMDTLRKLICCDVDDTGGLTPYTAADIHTAAPYTQIYPVSGNLDTGTRANLDAAAFAPIRIVVAKPFRSSIHYDVRLQEAVSVKKPLQLKRR